MLSRLVGGGMADVEVGRLELLATLVACFAKQWRMVLGLDLQQLIASVERGIEREGEGEGGAQAASIGS